MDHADHEAQLQERLRKIKALEEEILMRENALKNREGARKQILLRLAPSLWEKIASWAEDDFRSVNGQIEFILSEAVRDRFEKRNGK